MVTHPDGDGASSVVGMSDSLESALHDALYLRKPDHDWSRNVVYDTRDEVVLFRVYERGPADCHNKDRKYGRCEDTKWGEGDLEWVGPDKE